MPRYVAHSTRPGFIASSGLSSETCRFIIFFFRSRLSTPSTDWCKKPAVNYITVGLATHSWSDGFIVHLPFVLLIPKAFLTSHMFVLQISISESQGLDWMEGILPLPTSDWSAYQELLCFPTAPSSPALRFNKPFQSSQSLYLLEPPLPVANCTSTLELWVLPPAPSVADILKWHRWSLWISQSVVDIFEFLKA